MKKLLLFLIVLVFFGNTNAQEVSSRSTKATRTTEERITTDKRSLNDGVNVQKAKGIYNFCGSTTQLEYQTLTPLNNATNVELNAAVSVTFNENITGSLAGISISGGIAATASILEDKLIIDHDAFVYGKIYTVTIPAGAIDDYNQPITWKFTTKSEPTEEPIKVDILTPANGTIDVPASAAAPVSVTFNQNITKGNLSLVTIDNGIIANATVAGKKLTITHNSFVNNTKYTVKVPAGAIADFDEDIEWSFTTVVGSGIPVVNGNEINIFQNNSNIFVQLSENSDVRVLDVLGRVLGSYNVTANATLTINQLSGIYLIEVISNGNVSTHKVVVR